MYFSLLLQTHTETVTITSLTYVYIGLAGTLLAAGAATLASLAASSRAANAAKEVAELSRKTSQEVATLSAQVSRESAALAAQTARDIKEIDYKQSFYKMIMERRMQMWEDMEKMLTEIEPAIRYTGVNGRKSFKYFADGESFDKVYDKMRTLGAKQQLWSSIRFSNLYIEFFNKHIEIRRESARRDGISGRTTINDALIIAAGKNNFIELDRMLTLLFSTLNADLADMHNVENFINRYNITV